MRGQQRVFVPEAAAGAVAEDREAEEFAPAGALCGVATGRLIGALAPPTPSVADRPAGRAREEGEDVQPGFGGGPDVGVDRAPVRRAAGARLDRGPVDADADAFHPARLDRLRLLRLQVLRRDDAPEVGGQGGGGGARREQRGEDDGDGDQSLHGSPNNRAAKAKVRSADLSPPARPDQRALRPQLALHLGGERLATTGAQRRGHPGGVAGGERRAHHPRRAERVPVGAQQAARRPEVRSIERAQGVERDVVEAFASDRGVARLPERLVLLDRPAAARDGDVGLPAGGHHVLLGERRPPTRCRDSRMPICGPVAGTR